mmetsp:Transcript_37572/g.120531  ORF Transcript_37572/g.120531 Transcript_37572/m.120531 type:complete len:323 (+) Transcript_37572:1460-2428(+)
MPPSGTSPGKSSPNSKLSIPGIRIVVVVYLHTRKKEPPFIPSCHSSVRCQLPPSASSSRSPSHSPLAGAPPFAFGGGASPPSIAARLHRPRINHSRSIAREEDILLTYSKDLPSEALPFERAHLLFVGDVDPGALEDDVVVVRAGRGGEEGLVLRREAGVAIFLDDDEEAMGPGQDATRGAVEAHEREAVLGEHGVHLFESVVLGVCGEDEALAPRRDEEPSVRTPVSESEDASEAFDRSRLPRVEIDFDDVAEGRGHRESSSATTCSRSWRHGQERAAGLVEIDGTELRSERRVVDDDSIPRRVGDGEALVFEEGHRVCRR